MNLADIPIPSTCAEMIKTYASYYDAFCHEMVRMSNAHISDYLEQFIAVVTALVKRPGVHNIIRAAIGIVCLHGFGYNHFGRLARLFDRVLSFSVVLGWNVDFGAGRY
jgi:hypothetical protein